MPRKRSDRALPHLFSSAHFLAWLAVREMLGGIQGTAYPAIVFFARSPALRFAVSFVSRGLEFDCGLSWIRNESDRNMLVKPTIRPRDFDLAQSTELRPHWGGRC